MKRATVQFVLAVAVVVFTFAIATAGFSVSPPGEIHSSVLTLIGEFLGFAAALFGYNSKYHGKDNDA